MNDRATPAYVGSGYVAVVLEAFGFVGVRRGFVKTVELLRDALLRTRSIERRGTHRR